MRLILSPEELRVLSSSLPALELLSVNGHEYSLSDGLGGPAPSLAVDAPLDGIEVDSGMDAPAPTEADYDLLALQDAADREHDVHTWNRAVEACIQASHLIPSFAETIRRELLQ